MKNLILNLTTLTDNFIKRLSKNNLIFLIKLTIKFFFVIIFKFPPFCKFEIF